MGTAMQHQTRGSGRGSWQWQWQMLSSIAFMQVYAARLLLARIKVARTSADHAVEDDEKDHGLNTTSVGV